MRFSDCQNSVGKYFLDGGGGRDLAPGQGRTLRPPVQIGLNESLIKLNNNKKKSKNYSKITLIRIPTLTLALNLVLYKKMYKYQNCQYIKYFSLRVYTESMYNVYLSRI